MNPFDLSGRRFLVTGASSGIGRATAVLISQLGGKLVAVGRDESKLAALRDELQGDAHVIATRDLSSVVDLPMWLHELGQSHGVLHGMVHSAGVNVPQPLRALTTQDYLAMNAINVDAGVMLAKGFCHKSVSARPASIVFISSVAALRGQPSLAAYASGKGALIALTKTLAMELARENIRVNCVCPGFVEGPMADSARRILPPDAYRKLQGAYPLGFGTPLDVAYSIAFLLADTSRWITGTSLVVDGGYSA